MTESILVQDPLVQAVVMFGNGRVNAGVLVEPVPEHSFDPTDQQKLATFRAMIWYVFPASTFTKSLTRFALQADSREDERDCFRAVSCP